MNALSRLWRKLRGSGAASSTDLLAEARALSAAGDVDRASALYWKIKPRRENLEALLEHAELLLRLGDHFGAAGRAAAARRIDPDQPRAIEVQRRIRAIEEQEERERRAREVRPD